MNQAGWEYLRGVPQDPEADIIIGFLESQGIPVIKHYPEAGQFLKTAYGLTSGVDLYVPEEHLADAKQLLETTPADLEEEYREIPQLTHEKHSPSSKHWIIVLIIFLLALVLLANNFRYHLEI